MSQPLLRQVHPTLVSTQERDAVDAETMITAVSIVDDVRNRGEDALRDHGVGLGDLGADDPLVLDRAVMQQALDDLPTEDRDLLVRTADRIRAFAEAQKRCLVELTVDIPGGEAGHRVQPVAAAGCYAPGGRFPLPSSVLMTAVTARVAGVETVWVASPRPAPATLAAAAVAGADAFLAVGGAQAIAAFAYGAGPVPRCEAVVGPGNRFVTAAKQLVSGQVLIDMLAGPSELLVLADATADPDVVAADLLAQAEHDPDARPLLVTTEASLVERVNNALARQLEGLPTADTARAALDNGFAVCVADLDEAIRISDMLAPEHLEVMVAADQLTAVAQRLRHWGGLFIGDRTAEVLGDYGAGPNHVLPTGATARFQGGLSVLTFLRVATWLRIDDPDAAHALGKDAVRLARLEGLEAHARAALKRWK